MAVTAYDPLHAPDPKEWLALDETTRMDLAQAYHERMNVTLPNVRVHAIMHVIVENQVAEGDELPVRHRLQQLMAQGLNRHQALHAITSVLVQHMHHLTGDREKTSDPHLRYYAALRRIDAKKWLRSG